MSWMKRSKQDNLCAGKLRSGASASRKTNAALPCIINGLIKQYYGDIGETAGSSKPCREDLPRNAQQQHYTAAEAGNAILLAEEPHLKISEQAHTHCFVSAAPLMQAGNDVLFARARLIETCHGTSGTLPE